MGNKDLNSARGCILALAISTVMWTMIFWLLLTGLSGCAYATGKWTKKDVRLQVGVTALTAIDWLQTRAAAKQPDKYRETGPAGWFIGEHPSTEAVDLYFGCSVATKGFVTHVLPSEWRAWWQGLCMGISGALIIHNDRVGIGIQKAF